MSEKAKKELILKLENNESIPIDYQQAEMLASTIIWWIEEGLLPSFCIKKD